MLLLQGLESLTRDEHQHQWFNIKVLLKAGTVQRLLEGKLIGTVFDLQHRLV